LIGASVGKNPVWQILPYAVSGRQNNNKTAYSKYGTFGHAPGVF